MYVWVDIHLRTVPLLSLPLPFPLLPSPPLSSPLLSSPLLSSPLLSQYLESVRPLLNHKEFEEMKGLVEEFKVCTLSTYFSKLAFGGI